MHTFFTLITLFCIAGSVLCVFLIVKINQGHTLKGLYIRFLVHLRGLGNIGEGLTECFVNMGRKIEKVLESVGSRENTPVFAGPGEMMPTVQTAVNISDSTYNTDSTYDSSPATTVLEETTEEKVFPSDIHRVDTVYPPVEEKPAATEERSVCQSDNQGEFDSREVPVVEEPEISEEITPDEMKIEDEEIIVEEKIVEETPAAPVETIQEEKKEIIERRKLEINQELSSAVTSLDYSPLHQIENQKVEEVENLYNYDLGHRG